MHSIDLNEGTDLLTRLARFSDWYRMKRSIPWILRLKTNSSKKSLSPKVVANREGHTAGLRDNPLKVEELEKAERSF